jgi:hypothetical protein
MIRISVICATRKRSLSLQKSLASLINNADDPAQIEVLVAVDPDDPDSYACRDVFPSAHFWIAPERYGHYHLEKYYDELARQARGDWLFTWVDDGIMHTTGWDSIIVNHEPALLFPHLDGPQHCNAFPIWPSEWTRVLGHVSLTVHYDSWMQWIGEHLDVQQRVPIEITHRTPDDLTFREGSALQPNFGHTFDAALAADVEKLRQHLQGAA